MTRGDLFVLDVHHHVGSLAAMGMQTGTEAMSPEEATRADLEARLETMDRAGVDQAILIPGHLYLRPQGLADTRRVNDQIAAYRDLVPDRFPAAVGIVEPLYGEAGLEELTRIRAELHLAGVSFHTRFQGVGTNSPLVVDLVRRMATLDLLPFVHAVAEVPDEALWRVQALAEAVPDVPMIVLDAFSSHENAQQVFAVAKAAPHLVFDTSLAHSFHWLGRFLDEVGPDRLVFGTDIYSHVVAHDQNLTLDQLLSSAISDEAKRLVLADNARRLLSSSSPS